MIIDVILWLLILLPGILLLEAKRSVRKYIFSGKLFFGFSNELKLSQRTIVFLAVWLGSVPISFIAFVIILFRWS